MAQYSINRLNDLTAEYLESLTDMCCRAFSNDTAALVASGRNQEALADYYRALIAAAHMDGEIYVASLEGSKVPVSLAVWYPPGKVLWSTEEQRQLGFYNYLSKLDPATQKFMTSTFVEVLVKFFNECLSPKNELDAWVTYLVATEPEYQRQGIGSTLVKDIIPRVAGTGACLSLCATNDKNMEWYKNLGFTVKGNMPQVNGPTGSFPVYVIGMDVE